jgi:branched-chain amino acid transport system ATP-binding protein
MFSVTGGSLPMCSRDSAAIGKRNRFMSDVLVAEGLTKRFGGLIAVNGVDFRIRKDEATGIIGPNGSGKTTFFNLLSGFFPSNSGRIILFGDDITRMPPDKRVMRGMVRTFQLVSVFNRPGSCSEKGFYA